MDSYFGVGLPYLDERKDVWDDIGRLIISVNNRTMLLGDFNQVEYSCQKSGGTNYIPGREDFMKWRMNWQLTELPCKGARFT